MEKREEKPVYIYINKDGNPSTKSTRHVDANVDTQKKNQDHQNSSSEEEDVSFFSGLDYISPKTSPQATFPLWQNYGGAALTPSKFAFGCLTSCTS
jgi:hypothetical protein